MCYCSQQAHFPFKSTSKMLPPPQMVPIFDFSPFRIKHVLLLLLCVLFAEKVVTKKRIIKNVRNDYRFADKESASQLVSSSKIF